jgi:hypothetical protein
MPGIPEFAEGGIRKHPVSSVPGRRPERAKTGNRYPGSRNIAKDFHRKGINLKSIRCIFGFRDWLPIGSGEKAAGRPAEVVAVHGCRPAQLIYDISTWT